MEQSFQNPDVEGLLIDSGLILASEAGAFFYSPMAYSTTRGVKILAARLFFS